MLIGIMQIQAASTLIPVDPPFDLKIFYYFDEFLHRPLLVGGMYSPSIQYLQKPKLLAGIYYS